MQDRCLGRSCQTKPHYSGLDTPLFPVHWDFPCCHARRCCSQGDGHAIGDETAKHATLQGMAIAVCDISPTMPEEHIQNHRAIDPWSYATRIPILAWLGPWRCPWRYGLLDMAQNGKHSEIVLGLLLLIPFDPMFVSCPCSRLNSTQRHKILGNVPKDCLIGNSLDFMITRSQCKLQSKGNTSETLDIHYESSTRP